MILLISRVIIGQNENRTFLRRQKWHRKTEPNDNVTGQFVSFPSLTDGLSHKRYFVTEIAAQN